jgi:hypothetical protein
MAAFMLLLPVAVLAADPPAEALPKIGDVRPTVRLVDAWERPYDLAQVGDRPLLVMYEDKGSAGQNAAFKKELGELARGDRYKGRMVLAAVADVADYDYWPVSGFVKDAIRDESVKAGTPIYCDWDGSVRRVLGVQRGISSVILYGKDGHAVFSYEGPMPPDVRTQLVALLRRALA